MTAKRDEKSEPEAESLGLEAFRQPPEPAGLSLEQLSDALTGMLRSGDDPYVAARSDSQAGSPDEATADDAGDAAGDDADSSSEADDACEIAPRTILEAMLFVGHPKNEPLASKHVAGMMRGVRPAEIDSLVRELNRDYAARNCPYVIVAEGAGYRMTLRDEFSRMRDKFYGKVRQSRLSQPAIEVLAAVAYHQPMTADDLAKLRGMPSGHVLLQLVRRKLLRVEREEGKSRKSQYFTTDRFLQLFGLASLDDLPRSSDLEEA